ncbi:uncharacterized protein NECHADRAFT_77464 [Fusarium vanettenii 77-13-4]|uniref:Uncharacterized protein n=1 Tax=Fusarium vanettenii (strain ATCC MYA-4622 / CBS 123669 / FGSC 9596 / NRRL 45880 / 77-13-4) TaxID=660122 RepID=C7YLA8_FUSV7|nr:uncharacterized protein NECHADRAFT_77464 [Fusarium vanettenii 77-13-4]EEU46756.1 predicted protein [Fusarium vanettenii 77-13-4]
MWSDVAEVLLVFDDRAISLCYLLAWIAEGGVAKQAAGQCFAALVGVLLILEARAYDWPKECLCGGSHVCAEADAQEGTFPQDQDLPAQHLKQEGEIVPSTTLTTIEGDLTHATTKLPPSAPADKGKGKAPIDSSDESLGSKYAPVIQSNDPKDDFHPPSDTLSDDELPSVDRLVGRLRSGKKRARAHSSPTRDHAGPLTRRRRVAANGAGPSSSGAAATSAPTTNTTSHPMPQWSPGWEEERLIRTLKEKYEEDPAGFYLITDRFFLEWSQTVHRNGFGGYADWIDAKFGESQCCSGAFHAFPDATLTQCI